MEHEIEAKVVEIINEYRVNNIAYDKLVSDMSKMRDTIALMEKERLKITEVLKSTRSKEFALYEEVKARGIGIDEFKAEIAVIVKKINTK